MSRAVIVATARTPLTKSWKGAFNLTHGATLGAFAVKAAVERAGIDAAEVEDVIMGCATPEGATGSNIARQIALRAGLPITTSGVTINRFCSSGLQTIALAAQRIMAGEGDIYVGGGVESISCVQQEANTHMIADPWLVEHKPEIYWNMLQTAENVAQRYGIPKSRMDEYGAASQQKACAAQEKGLFNDELVSVTVTPEQGYGVPDEGLVQSVARSAFPGVDALAPGMRFQAGGPQGTRVVVITQVAKDLVTVDANHPLAGQTLHFEVELATVRDATREELEHGHVHGAGGHHHH